MPDPSLPTVPARADDGFQAYAVRTRSGPHVTIQAGTLLAGRFWTTTSRTSLKSRSVAAHRTAGVLVEHDDGTTEVLRGRTVALDPTAPTSALRDPAAALAAGPAVLRLAAGQAEQLLGYLEAARAIPLDWFPHRREVLVTRVEDRIVLDGWDVVDAAGAWDGEARPLRARRRSRRPLVGVPGEVRSLVSPTAPVRLGVDTDAGPVPLPARWLGEDRVAVSRAALADVGARLPGRGSLTFDDSADRRPDRKLGLLLRGDLGLVALDGPVATVAVRADRVTTWDGFRARTLDAVPGARTPAPAGTLP